MAMQRVVLTYKDHEATPNDGRRYEIVSPSTTRNDRGTKLQLYARYGVPPTGSRILWRER